MNQFVARVFVAVNGSQRVDQQLEEHFHYTFAPDYQVHITLALHIERNAVPGVEGQRDLPLLHVLLDRVHVLAHQPEPTREGPVDEAFNVAHVATCGRLFYFVFF